ncbi:MAG: hypothetical protein M1818_004543 [Claussenomyces sp. TS43310]|nr:MAG: hypothetical protein M1818_004543 [Claussenomyces sp. TS43310]
MTSPLSPKSGSALNAIMIPSTTPPGRSNTTRSNTTGPADTEDDFQDAPSSPFVANVLDDDQRGKAAPFKAAMPLVDGENMPVDAFKLAEPNRRAIQPGAKSPLKVLKSRSMQSPTKPLAVERSPRKLSSPEKRFPVKVSMPAEARPVSRGEKLSPSKKIPGYKEGFKDAVQILEDEDTILDYVAAEDTLDTSDDTMLSLGEDAEPEGFADETAFSTFSAVPDMTMFAKIGHSPTKSSAVGHTPGRHGLATPATSRKPVFNDQDASPTPRKLRGLGADAGDSGTTTNLILDFTEQFNNFSRGQQSPTRRGHPSPSRTVPELLAYTQRARTPSPVKFRSQAHSPASRMSNLLDFDIPPAPTPRSMPSITPRELESLKSGFLSEISSLKASLSGKEAEVLSLKTAVGDAEKRVGECLEQLREERNLKEQLTAEKEGWEKRGREMEQVLRNVKEEIVHGERERENLEGRLDESEKRREAAEMMAQEAESKMAGMRAGSTSGVESESDDKATSDGSAAREVEMAVEKVARELHTLYKGKHETKVAALKKSYEGRWDRKVKELEAQVEDLNRENEELKIGGNATMSGVVPPLPADDVTEELRQEATRHAQSTKALEARLDGLTEEVRSLQRDNTDLRRELEQERVEKGELVVACDELLALQSTAAAAAAPPAGVENLRGSISRASGLRAPNFSSSASSSSCVTGAPAGAGRILKADRSRSGSAQGMRPGGGGIMSSIERMGSYKGRTE